MQHIIVMTARPQKLHATDWVTNGVGRNGEQPYSTCSRLQYLASSDSIFDAVIVTVHVCLCVAVSHSFGYGLMDATAMVELALNWTTVPTQHKCEIKSTDSPRWVLSLYDTVML